MPRAFPWLRQQAFDWIVPAYVGAPGVSSVVAGQSARGSRSRRLLVAVSGAVAYALWTISKLSVHGNAHGGIPSSSGVLWRILKWPLVAFGGGGIGPALLEAIT